MTLNRADQWRAWAASLLLHFALLSTLTAVVWHERQEEWLPAIQARLDEAAPQTDKFEPPVDLVEFLSQSGSPAVGPVVDEQIVSAPLAAGLNTDVNIGPLAGEGGLGEGGLGGKGSAETGIGFFGTRGTASSVVFVVDMSGSMENGRFIRAQQELVKSIHKLHVTQKFYVIFFNSHAVPMFFPSPAKEMVSATPLMKRKVTRWITERRTGQGTDPEEALLLALALKPEVIYVLTDGEFPENCRELVKTKNTSGAVINTIALQSRDGIPLLQDIASDNNGVFLFVK